MQTQSFPSSQNGGSSRAWPIAQLHQNQDAFLEEVVRRSLESLLRRYSVPTELRKMLAQTVSKERNRVEKEAWQCDPKDDRLFWAGTEYRLHKGSEDVQLLSQVLVRYAGEIRSSFRVKHYRFVAKMIRCAVHALLKPILGGGKVGPAGGTAQHPTAGSRLQVSGAIETVRRLSQRGTVVLVPTHVSNWDSVIVGLVAQQVGLSPLTWGAGLNLFNNRGFRYVFDALGTYKVDRRKKNVPYLEIQKAYARLALEWGCPMLFYPGGTRSRSGAIEKNLKLGFLSTPFAAQAHLFHKEGSKARKVFIVPTVLNYHCVLEAEQLIREFVADGDSMHAQAARYGCSTQLLWGRNLLWKASEVFVAFGTPLDVMGHDVDAEGHSLNARGEIVDLHAAVQKMQRPNFEHPPTACIKALSQKITETYARIQPVVSSHLVAFVAYELAQKAADFSMHRTDTVIPHALFMRALEKSYEALSLLYAQKAIDFTPILKQGSVGLIFEDGLAHLGVYHARQPLVRTQQGDVRIQNMWTLLYYRNRLLDYELEKSICAC